MAIKIRLLYIFLFLCNIQQVTLAQSESKFGLKVGIAFSQFPSSDKKISSREIEEIKINPVIGVLTGISKSWTIRNHLVLNAGLDFHKSGTNKYTMSRDLLGTIIEYSEIREYLRMYKICLPFSLGYVFNGNVRPAIYAGLRPNFIFSGGIDYKIHNHYRIDSRYSGTEDTYSKNGTLLSPHKRIMNQYIIGISSSISKHIVIDLNYNIGYNFYETVYTVKGNYSTYMYTQKTSVPACDFTVSLHYKFVKRDKNSIDK